MWCQVNSSPRPNEREINEANVSKLFLKPCCINITFCVAAGWEQRGAPGAREGPWPRVTRGHAEPCAHPARHDTTRALAPSLGNGGAACSWGWPRPRSLLRQTPFPGASPPPGSWRRELVAVGSRAGTQPLAVFARASAARSKATCLLNSPIYLEQEFTCIKGYFC